MNGHTAQNLATKRLRDGRRAFAFHLASRASLARTLQEGRNQKREDRVRPEVIRPIGGRRIINPVTGREEILITSELRREHWPEPAPRPTHQRGESRRRYDATLRPFLRRWAA